MNAHHTNMKENNFFILSIHSSQDDKSIEKNLNLKSLENDIENQFCLFNEISIRRAFTIKVFRLLSILLAETVAFSLLCMYYRPLKYFWEENPSFILYPIPVYFVCALSIILIPSVRRRSPWNYINLFVFSCCVTAVIGGICALAEENTILIAFGVTTVLVFGLIFYAKYTECDFTQHKNIGLSLIIVIFLTFVTWLPFVNNSFKLLGACVCIVTFSVLLIQDIQQIIEGKHAYKISPEDHVLAVTMLYLGIVNLFLNILQLIK